MKNLTRNLLWVLAGIFLAAALTLSVSALKGGQAAGLSLNGTPAEAATLGPDFTYQGRLLKDGQPVSGACDFEFNLYSAATGGSLLGGPLDRLSTPVAGGLFNVTLNFSPALFNGQALYLEPNVRCPAGAATAYTPMARQLLSAAPYAQYSQNANTLDGKEGAEYQARVSGACPLGKVMVAIGPDGGAVCWTDAPLNRANPPQGNSFLDVDDTGAGGGLGVPSEAGIGGNGLPLIAYYDLHNEDLKVAACHDLLCGSAQVTTLDQTDEVGGYLSLAIGADGLGLITYDDETLYTLKVAHCQNPDCTSATITTLDGSTSNWAGTSESIAIGPDGLALIAYRYVTTTPSTTYAIKVAHCSNLACTAATYATPLTPSYVQEISLAFGVDGLGLIAYWDTTALKVIHCSNLLCTSASSPVTIDASGSGNSITIGADGLPLIAYMDATNNRLKVAHCSDVACSTFNAVTLESVKTSYSPSVTIGADGLGVIAYQDSTNFDLRVAHCSDLACSKATFFSPDTANYTGYAPWVTIGADGLPFISYAADVSYILRLKAAHCASPFCTPYFRRP